MALIPKILLNRPTTTLSSDVFAQNGCTAKATALLTSHILRQLDRIKVWKVIVFAKPLSKCRVHPLLC